MDKNTVYSILALIAIGGAIYYAANKTSVSIPLIANNPSDDFTIPYYLRYNTPNPWVFITNAIPPLTQGFLGIPSSPGSSCDICGG